jgi:hypothetical protein
MEGKNNMCPICNAKLNWNTLRGMNSFSFGKDDRSNSSVVKCVNGHVLLKFIQEISGVKMETTINCKKLHEHAISEFIWSPKRFIDNFEKWVNYKPRKN